MVTGRVPAPVRARVLAEYRAELAERRRATVTEQVRHGVHVQRVPYGYRALARPGWTGPTGRAVMAPPWTWSVDPDAAQAIDAMALWYLAGRSDAWIAGRLTYARGYPHPLNVHGTERDFTAALVARILTDPTWTGRQAWGRTRAGRPLPRAAWEPLGGFSHPAVIDLATSARLLRCRADRRRPGVCQRLVKIDPQTALGFRLGVSFHETTTACPADPRPRPEPGPGQPGPAPGPGPCSPGRTGPGPHRATQGHSERV